jgi:hypothetical protein
MKTVLSTVMTECKNHFVKTIEKGNFSINDSVIQLSGNYPEGVYLWVTGSLLNDGVYQVTDNLITLDGARNEQFDGAVCTLAVPAEFAELCDGIEKYIDSAQEDSNGGRIVSETYAGYTYHLATDSTGQAAGWETAFATRLNKYRRMYPEKVI